ncbi:NAD(P)/FAD-dependent oxidoreductase [Nocardia ninae]
MATEPKQLRSHTSSEVGHCLVLGSGFAGLLAAHVLAEHGMRVTIIEPDPLPDHAESRRGTPQDRHPHGLLQRGAEVLESFFPGLDAELRDCGAHVFDFGEHARVLFPGGWAAPVTSQVYHHASSRPLLEWVIRRRVLRGSTITVADRTRARNLLWRNGKVIGIEDNRDVSWHADLVVDATGRGSKLGDWLTGAGLTPPPARHVRAQLSYTSRLYECPPDYRPPWQLSAELTYAPSTRHGAVATRIENDRILLTLIGADGAKAPRNENGFRDYALSLRSPDFHEILSHTTPLSNITCYSGLHNDWQPYHRMHRWPDGLIALGDAVCTLNPIYGQGMTVAAVEAATLQRILTRRSACEPGFARTLQHAIPAAIRLPWRLAAYSDIGWRATNQRKTLDPRHRIVRWVVDRIPEDPELYRRFIPVQNLLTHPVTLARPALRLRSSAPPHQTHRPRQPDRHAGTAQTSPGSSHGDSE